MPELPEVETMRRGILPIQNGRIEEVSFLPLPLKPIAVSPKRPTLRRRLIGRNIDSVSRLGKRILLHLDSLEVLVIEPRMTGIVLLRDAPDREHLRIEFQLANATAECFQFWDRRGLGTVQLLKPKQVTELRNRLGPDAVGLASHHLRDRLRHSRRQIKVALLDQAVVAGIGNLYASEILHVARISPMKRCHRLTRADWERLNQAVETVLSEAIHYEGSTLSDGTYRNALNQSGSYQNHHRVYARADKPCPDCNTLVQRDVQAQRSTFWCPSCQPRR